MSNKKLVTLAIVAVIMVAIAVMLNSVGGDKSTGPVGITYLIQGLNVDNVASIMIGKAGDHVVLNRKENVFVVASKDDYPARGKEVNDLITKCLDIRADARQLVTSNPANHDDLAVSEEKAQYVVKFFDGGGNVITGVAISGRDMEKQGGYVRLINSDEVYFTTNIPWLRTGAMDYIDKDLLSVSAEEIEQVQVIGGEGGYTLKKSGEGDEIILENMPEDKQFKDTDYKQVFEALTNISFTDVQSTSASKELEFDTRFVCTLKDSTVYMFDVAQKDEKFFVKCTAEFTDTTPVTKDKTVVESEEELKAKEAKLLARDNAAAFAEQHKGWVYEIAEYNGKNLAKKMGDLLEDIEEAEPEAEEEASVEDS